MSDLNFLSRASTPGDGATEAFSVPFPYLLPSQVAVYLRPSLEADGVLQTLGVDYTFTSQGVITFGHAPLAGYVVDRIRMSGLATAVVRLTPPATLSSAQLNAIDTQLLYLLQEEADARADLSSRSFQFASPYSGPRVPDNRASKFLSFDAQGNLTVSSGTGVDEGLRTDLAEPGGIALINVIPPGLTGNGTTDERAGLLASTSLGNTLVLPKGTYLIEGDLTLPNNIIMQGGLFYIAAGATLTITGSIEAPPVQIFAGPGTVNLRSGYTRMAYPEWWGAVAGVVSAAQQVVNTVAITQAFTAHAIVILACRDYHTNDTLPINIPFVSLLCYARGDGSLDGHGCRILSHNGGSDAVRIGPAVDTHTNPPYSTDTSSFVSNIYIRGIQATVVGAPPPPGGHMDDGICGFRLQFCKDVYLEECKALELFVGFRVYAAAGVRLVRCQFFRSNIVAGSTADMAYGFYLQGSPSVNAGGNASLYLVDCASTVAGAATAPGALPSGSIAVFCFGNFTDTFLIGLETSGHQYGIVADGNDALGSNPISQGDLKVADCVLDLCKIVGIWIKNTTKASAIRITGGYVGLVGGQGGQANVWLQNTWGSVVLADFQLIGSGECPGLRCSTADGVICTELQVTDCGGAPVTIDGGCGNISVRGTINNPTNLALDKVNNPSGTSPVSAVYIKDASNRIFVDMAIKGQNGAFSAGVILESGQQNCTVERSNIDTNCVANPGGIPNKVQINTLTATTPGWYSVDGSGVSPTAGIGHDIRGSNA